MAQNPKLLVQIRDLIVEVFSLDDIREICFLLEEDYDDLAGETKSARSLNLVRRMEQQGKLDELLGICANRRSHINWPKLSTPVSSDVTLGRSSSQNQRGTHRIPIWIWGTGAVIVVGVLAFYFLSQLGSGGGDNSLVVPTGTPLDMTGGVVAVKTDMPTSSSTHTVEPEPINTRQLISTPKSTITITATPALTSIPTSIPSSILGIGSTHIRLTDEAVMVYVPAGEFAMGSDDGDDDERPIHGVHLDSYWIDQTEVTNGMYTLCERAGVCKQPSALRSRTRSSYYPNPAYADYPVIYVSWDDAKTYCEWAGGRLPTEAEWEKAVRWDEENQEARIYPWGEDIDCNFANYDDCVGDTSAVGSYPDGASPYGALDMAGNVWEWVNDVYASNYYEQRVYDNPTGPMDGSEMVRRGGSWSRSDGSIVRAADRSSNIPSYPNDLLGFRCVQD